MKFKNLPIFNRGDKLPDDGWYHVVPMGEFKIRHDGKTILQVIDNRAIAAMVDRFVAAGAKLLVDFEHFSYDTSKKSEASGWITEVEARETGLWAKIEWTDIGEPAIKNKRYRFVSPVWLPEECESIANNKIRPLALDSVGLTNSPNMKGMQPLSNRGGGEQLPNSPKTTETPKMKKVLNLLGLQDDASEDSAVTALTALQNKAQESDALKNRAEKAEAKIDAIQADALESDAEAFCDTHKDIITNREDVKKQFIANRDGTEALFAGLKISSTEEKGKKSLKNRATKQPNSDSETTVADEKKAAAIANRASKISATEGIPFGTAFDRAKAELA